ncbi:hypothetical protein ACIGO8_23985 [Streptomyces sp. NPDC053493]|uniref:hypothetical protein n=1 Tax=Streptomyces sp. NPDC053493 TaxID=3365705 RepID=UPI0037D3475D
MREPSVPRARRWVTFLAAAALTAAASAAASAAPASGVPGAPEPADNGRPAAVALKPVVAVSGWRSTGPSGEVSARAQCPAGYHATGGGAETDGVGPHLSTSIGVPLGDNPDGWSVTARNYSTDGGMSLRAYVICDQAAHEVRQITTFDVPFGQTGEATATCPPGTTASGGGYMAIGIGPGDQSVFLVHDSATGNGRDWRAEGTNFALDPGFITAQVICSTQPHVVRLGDTVHPPHPTTGRSSAGCRSALNELPTGGGQIVGTRVYIQDSFPTPWGWDVTALNTSGETQPVTAQVICRPLG